MLVPLNVSGLVSPGLTSTFKLEDSAEGVPSILVRETSVGGTLADIAISLRVGLIENKGLASPRLAKIQAVQSASGLKTKCLRCVQG